MFLPRADPAKINSSTTTIKSKVTYYATQYKCEAGATVKSVVSVKALKIKGARFSDKY